MFRTEISIPEAPFKIDHRTPVLTIGSCFSDCIGQKFAEGKFKVLKNPFGTIFNPHSIFKVLEMALGQRKPADNGFIEVNGLYQHFDFHSKFTAQSKPALEKILMDRIRTTHTFLANAEVIIITLGTALVYEHITHEEIVANCHKIPQQIFRKYMLTLEQIENRARQLLESIPATTQVIFTVSPVRHIKDTLIINSASKALLRVACEIITKKHPNAHYFPSFEILMDDLRDYRFYRSDMIHPSETAEEYIWEKFVSTHCTEATKGMLSEWKKVRAALSHRPFNPASEAHQKFIAETIKKLRQFSDKFDISSELDLLKQQLL